MVVGVGRRVKERGRWGKRGIGWAMRCHTVLLLRAFKLFVGDRMGAHEV